MKKFSCWERNFCLIFFFFYEIYCRESSSLSIKKRERFLFLTFLTDTIEMKRNGCATQKKKLSSSLFSMSYDVFRRWKGRKVDLFTRKGAIWKKGAQNNGFIMADISSLQWSPFYFLLKDILVVFLLHSEQD